MTNSLNRVIALSLYVLMFLFSCGQLGRLSFQSQVINGYFYELWMGVMFIMLLIQYKLIPFKNIIQRFRLELLFFAYLLLLFSFTALQYSFGENLTAFLYVIRLSFYALFFLYLYEYIKHTYQKNAYATKEIFVFLFITITTSFMQYFLYSDFNVLYYLGWDPHLYRLVGLFFDPPVTAAVLGMMQFGCIH